MFQSCSFESLKKIMEDNLEENLYFKKPKITITDMSDKEESYTFVQFRFKDNTLKIPQLYLSKKNTGTGTKILIWLEEFCINNGITKIQLKNIWKRGTSEYSKEMHNIIKKLGYEVIEESNTHINCEKTII
ncbi:hypothetical protein [Senegalia massiliensis]|uniref:Uncharacterized protein n=1 Tax=Senegalia massiliensis TaxID=1720316 RepID=A0A845R557_9CLOT|nr:hypothetical protein [Senegalia massiliensis]NBI07643.1 hypothetical protein [Senegalia massiliensis]